MMPTETLKWAIEALLMAADEPLSIKALQKLLTDKVKPFETDDLNQALAQLQQDYQSRSVDLLELANGYVFRVKQQYSEIVSGLWEEKPPKYSRAFLETLALIAYRQPLTRAEIEEVRGVAVSSHIIKTLMEHEWVKVIGHREVPGKPALLATTKKFLDHFNLKSLAELPPLEALQDLEKIGEQLQIQLPPTDQDSEHSTAEPIEPHSIPQEALNPTLEVAESKPEEVEAW